MGSQCARRSTSICFQILPEVLLLATLVIYAILGALVLRWAEHKEVDLNISSAMAVVSVKKFGATSKGYAFSKMFCDSMDYPPVIPAPPDRSNTSSHISQQNMTTESPHTLTSVWTDIIFSDADVHLPENATDWALCSEKVAWGYSKFEAKQYAMKGLNDPCDEPHKGWDLLHATIFAGTLFTTIGYGEVAPETDFGRAFTILYSLLGIPLFLVLLSRLGKLFAKAFVHVWIRFRAAVCNYQLQIEDELMEAAVERMDFPLPIAVAIAFGWLFLCSLVFCVWEDWSYFTSIYFTFITLTTIGLGDVTPKDSTVQLLGCFMVVIGLSLISMVLDLLQRKIEEGYLVIMKKVQMSSLDELDLEQDPDMAVQNMIRGKSGKLKNTLWGMAAGEARKKRLREEWDRRRNQRVQSVQIDPSEWTTDAEVQCELISESTPNTDISEMSKSSYTRILIPLKETRGTPPRRSGSAASSSRLLGTAGPSSMSIASTNEGTVELDDVKVMIRSIDDILGDCQSILHSEASERAPVSDSNGNLLG